MTGIEAQFDGFCQSCECKIEVGQEVINRNDAFGWTHRVCPAPVERPVVVCVDCWLIQPCECAA